MPTLIIFSANDPDNRLNQLSSEGKEIQRTLNSAYAKAFDTALIPDASIHDVIEELKVPNREVEIVHYAGHATSDLIQLADVPADATALAEKLRGLGTVKLLFLNGCATKGQVHFFHDAGIPFVIATSRPVDDNRAHWVATQFYQYLSLGRSLREAYAEVVTDAQKLNKKVSFSSDRGMQLHAESAGETESLPWGLYIKAGGENNDYNLPFSRQHPSTEKVIRHTSFLNKLILALATSDSSSLASIRGLAPNIARGTVPDNRKISELLKVLPLPLGIRLRQITAEPESRTEEYFRDLLYDYAFFFETLLHQSCAMLFAEAWQQDLKPGPETSIKINAFLHENRPNASPDAYREIILVLLASLKEKTSNASLYFSKEAEQYLLSEKFQGAADFFFLHKRYFWQRVRLKEDEAIENCFQAQEFVSEAFQYFNFLATHVMTSVRGINVVNFRYVQEEYDNILSRLIVTEADPVPLTGHKMMENRSILCFNQSDFDLETPSLNLFPFFIDRNVFTGKPNNEVDIYLYAGYFIPEGASQPSYHFVSAINPGKIWRFDETSEEVSLLHIGETASFTHEANHLMASTWEFRHYLNEFKNQFINP